MSFFDTRDYELLKDWKNKLESYKKHLEIMGDYRNSYSKTDHDASFMRMKEDHMKNGQLKAAYNIQLASASGFIIGENISHHPSDMYTLKPFLMKFLENYRGKENIISEICLLSIGLNLNKLASKIENKNLEIIKYKAA